jgi:hypothetical protein
LTYGVIQVLHQGTIRFIEVKFFFQKMVAGVQESLALGVLYSSVDASLKGYSHGALNVFKHDERSLVVIKADSILSVVAMVPSEQDGGGSQFFLVEKFALGVIHSDNSLDEET